MERSLTYRTITNISSLITENKRSNIILFIVIFVTVFSLTPLIVLGGAIVGFGVVLAVLVALTIAALAVRWPIVGFFVILGCVVLLEQDPLRFNIFTNNLYVFAWPPGLTGLIERPIGFLILFILLVYICHRLMGFQLFLRGGEFIWPFSFLLLCVAVGVVHGLTSGGDFKIIVLEVRPFWYMFTSYLLAYNLMKNKCHVRAFFWIVIVAAGIKALQGLYIVFILLHGNLEGQNEIMAHEESFFFTALLLLMLLFFLHHRYRPQLTATLLILPCVLLVLIDNKRRADYLALLVGILVVWAIIFCIKPRARVRLAIGMLIFVALGGAYVVAFARSSGGLAEPARAIASIVSPDYSDVRDTNSNLYRLIENYDLKYTVKQNPLLGLGFGKPFLEPEPLPDISNGDPYYYYVPHNTIYWVWMRLGPIGFFALWFLFGAFIVRGCLIARQLKDPYLQLVAIYTVAIVFMEVIVAFADYQLFFYRNVIYLGLLVGMLLKLPSFDEKKCEILQ